MNNNFTPKIVPIPIIVKMKTLGNSIKKSILRDHLKPTRLTHS